MVLGTLVIICVVIPWFIIALLILVMAFLALNRYYVATSRSLKRLDSVSKSPVLSHFTATLSGLPLVRALRKQQNFEDEFSDRIDIMLRSNYTFQMAQRWVGVRLDLVAIIAITITSFLCIILRYQLNPGSAGLILTQSVLLTGLMQYMVRQAAETENLVTCVERMQEYCKLPKEDISGMEPHPEWPNGGKIKVNNLIASYPTAPDKLILRGIHFEVPQNTKLGVVGRTGSGKSSLLLTFFRILDVGQGMIYLDGLDISCIPLPILRARMAVIPQALTLFTGTVRTNLDPFNHYKDEEIWAALERVHLKNVVVERNGQLNAVVSSTGDNFSVGQKQLLCMARALLKGSKLIFMDEATSAVDSLTDSLIQDTVRTEFVGCTVVTIAHRINTVIDYDLILVLGDGEVVEFGAPSALLSDPTSLFASYAKSADVDSTTNNKKEVTDVPNTPPTSPTRK
eukprot:NODE_2514_length_1561_cov_48.312935_g2165_i0.p1 GENE.NODE_2514_length_1561_cov_48.312935_g2165_i0~~NODE_2514_length_1561_cov_48.312935_g2165_i0.p1  ORF type:complete len:472 (-),score=85.77 NODE_2514_length_1561_cov_48.312935_g2165_i0:146-1510(-)